LTVSKVALNVIGFCKSNIFLAVSYNISKLVIVVPILESLKTSRNLSNAFTTPLALKVLANYTVLISKCVLPASVP
jgi:hypothetical protein